MVPLRGASVSIQLSFHLRWNTSNEAAGRNILRDHGSCRHKGALTDGDAIQDDGTDADQAAVLKGCTMHHGSMTNGDISANGDGRIGITMKNGAILHVAARANRDRRHIPPGNRQRPKACVSGHLHIPHHHSTFSNPSPRINLRRRKHRALRAAPVSHQAICRWNP